MRRVQQTVAIIVAALLIVVSAGWAWWAHVRQDPNRVFWDMISNNLSTTSVTRVSLQGNNGLELLQYTQMNFGQHPTAHALTVFKQKNNTLATEEISDQHHDMVRYQQIHVPDKAGKALNASAITGKWAQLQSGQSVNQLTSGLFHQSLLDVLPFANLNPAERNNIIMTMHQQKVFSFDSSAIRKVAIKGRPEYLYAVNIKPDAYIRVMQQFESLIGVKSYASLKASDYAHSAPISVVISIDTRSHELGQVYDAASQRAEVYQGFGITMPAELPTATITAPELVRWLARLQQ